MWKNYQKSAYLGSIQNFSNASDVIVVPVAQNDAIDGDAIKVEGLLEVEEVFRLLAIAGIEKETTGSNI